MKKERHSMILQLIDQYNISNQEELRDKLLSCGIDVTQATVSRDIKELRLIKQPAAGGEYKYSLAGSTDEKYVKYHAIFFETVTNVDTALNICVVKCHIGTAMAACAAIDALNIPDIVGTLAGDDTIFIACRTENAASSVKDELLSLLKS